MQVVSRWSHTPCLLSPASRGMIAGSVCTCASDVISVSHSSSAIEAFLKARYLKTSPEADVGTMVSDASSVSVGNADCHMTG